MRITVESGVVKERIEDFTITTKSQAERRNTNDTKNQVMG